MHKKLFCYNCNMDVEVDIFEEKRKYNIKDCEYEILDNITVCKKCGEEVFNKDKDGMLLEKLNNRYRIEHDLLFPSDIRKLREMYSLTQREFSKLLGFGDATISRYENGAIQDKSVNDFIVFCKKPSNIRELLNRRWGELSDNIKQKVNSFLSSIPTIFDIADMFIFRFIENNKPLTNMHLQKLCYFFWANMIVLTDKYLDIEFQAWRQGPVNYNLYQKYRSYGSENIEISQSEIDRIDVGKFDKRDLDIFEYIMNNYGDYSAEILSQLSHEENAWKEANPYRGHSSRIIDYKKVIKQREDEFDELIF